MFLFFTAYKLLQAILLLSKHSKLHQDSWTFVFQVQKWVSRLFKRWNQWLYLIMNSSQAWGFLLSPSMTGPYSCGSSPYCDMISPISAASGWWSINDSKTTVSMAVIHTHECGNNVSWTVFHVTSMYQCLGRWWSPPAPSSSPACNDLPRSGPQGTYHMAQAWIRNSESTCVSGNFLSWKLCGVCLVSSKRGLNYRSPVCWA